MRHGLVWVDAQRPPCVRPDDQVSISMSKRGSQEGNLPGRIQRGGLSYLFN
jgi:hypothetical protein